MTHTHLAPGPRSARSPISWTGRPMLMLLAALVACGSVAATAPAITPPEAFTRHCSTCHGPVALGSEPFFPSLVQRARALDVDDLVFAILRGKFDRAGELRGHTIPLMPAWDYLANEEIAAIANYLLQLADRSEWPIDAEAVASIRVLESDPEALLPMTRAEFDHATALYFEHCPACHGVDRLGAAGSPLQDWAMRATGSEAIRTFLHYGSPLGMPNWGTSGALNAADMSLLARFLQLEPPPRPAFDAADVRDSWQVLVHPDDRPDRRQFPLTAGDLFVALLHDVGAVALLDGHTGALVQTVATGLAPHAVALGEDRRMLYVLGRGGTLAMIDLYPEEPVIVARLRIGFEARALAISGDHVLAGAYWPPQITLLQASDLRPLATQSLDEAAFNRQHTAQRAGFIARLGRDRFLVATRHAGDLLTVDSRSEGDEPLAMQPIGRLPFARQGVLGPDRRFYLVPSDDSKLAVIDAAQGAVHASVELPGSHGGNPGSAWIDPQYGPVVGVSAMGSDTVSVIGADPTGHAQHAWRRVRNIRLPSGGALTSDTHPESRHLWVDMAINGNPAYSRSVAVVDLDEPMQPAVLLPIVEWAGVDPTSARAVHPQFNADGSAVWITVYNRQDEASAIVIVDDETLKPVHVVRDTRLVTPTRTFRLAGG